MKLFSKFLNNNAGAGKITILILILAVIIAAVLAFWIVVVLDFVYDGDIPWEPWEPWKSWDISGFLESWEPPWKEWNLFSGRDKGDDDGEDEPGDGTADTAPDETVSVTAPPAAVTPGPAPSPVPDGIMPDEIIDINIQEAYPELFKELDAICDKYNSAAVTLSVYDGESGKFFNYEFGYADIAGKREAQQDTKFYIASLTKLVTAICAMTLADDGLISLDTDISNYFGYEVRNPEPDAENIPITVRMLMQHTSSIFDSGAFEQSRELGSSESVRLLLERGSSFRRSKPGSAYEYSNFGYAVLGSLCERVSGKTLDDFAREVLFTPLGIDAAYVPGKLKDTGNLAVIYDSSHSVSRSIDTQMAIEESATPGHDLHLAASNLTISAADYAKILAMLGNGGVFRDTRILSSSSVNEIHKANIEAPGFHQGLAVRYSEGDIAGSDGYYWHTGSAYGIYSQFIYNTNPNRGVVVITSGASVNRLDNNMINACTELSQAVWGIFELIEDEDDGEDDGET